MTDSKTTDNTQPKKEIKEGEIIGETQSKKLYRSTKDRMIAGVCGGLGEYFNVDSSLIRLLFVAIVFAGGAGLLIYIVLWIILPNSPNPGKMEDVVKENMEEIKEKADNMVNTVQSQTKKDDSRLWWGLIVIGVGFIFLFDNFGFFRLFHLNFADLWPLILIIVGILILRRNQ